MDLTGKIKVISDEQQVSSTFRKRELVIITDEQYSQTISIEFTQDKCDLLNSYRLGEDVKVSINIGGREWVNPQGETKYFNSIKGWRIERLSAAPAPQNTAKTETNPQQNQSNFTEEEHDDIPF